MSRIIRPDARLVQGLADTLQQLPVDRPVVQYIRQSSIMQVKYNKQSFILQDEKLSRRLTHMGFTSIIPISADQGKSGQKLRFQREGLDELYRKAEHGEIGAIAFYDASRLWRDPTHIWYNDYIQMCIKYNLPNITFHRIYWPTDQQDMDALREDFKQAAFYLRHIYEKMIPAKLQAIEEDASYGGGAVPPGYVVVGEKGERKYYVVYEPHAKVIRWLFKRFRELGGNLPRLGRECREKGVAFPAFSGIEKIPCVALRFDGTGYPLKTRDALESILTNPVYIGWYVYSGVVVSKEAHDAIVPLDDFMYAYNHLSTTTLDGEVNEQNPKTDRRYGVSCDALLEGILESDGNPVYVIAYNQVYKVLPYNDGWTVTQLALPVRLVDSVFTDFLLTLLTVLEKRHEKGLQDSLYKQLTALQEEKGEQVTTLEDQLAKIDKAIRGWELDKQAAREQEYKPGIDEANKQLKLLHTAKLALEAKAQKAEREKNELAKCRSLVDEALHRWDSLKFERKRRFVRLLVEKANMREVAPHIIQIDALLRDPFRNDFTIYLFRKSGTHDTWTDEELECLRRLYPHADRLAILQALPTRTWRSIMHIASDNGFVRDTRLNTSDIDPCLSYADIQLIQALGLNPGQTLHEIQADAIVLALTQFSEKLKSAPVPAPHP